MSLPDDIKYIRITDFDDYGIPLGHQFMTAEMIENDYILEHEDMLFARSGATAGKTFLYTRDIGRAIFAGYCIRFRFDPKLILPRFVYYYTKTKRYQEWVSSIQRPVGQPNINRQEFKSFEVPVPPLDVQRTLVAEMETANAARRAQIAQANDLLVSIDAYLLEQLGLSLPPEEKRAAFAVRLGKMRSTQRLNADYFHPERVAAIQAMQSNPRRLQVKKLIEIVDFIRIITTPGERDKYIGLANVESHTGELIETSDEGDEGQCFRFSKNDVLFARLRPYLNKIYRAEDGGVCSTEFHVLRVKSFKSKGEVFEILPDYLAAILRSSLILAQTRHMMTGNTHPRLANDDVINLLIPIPKPPTIQEIIAAEVDSRRKQARRLRAEAKQKWEITKGRFEQALLGAGG